MTNDRLTDHLDRLRAKPQHVRHNIAMLTAAVVTGLVAVTWMTAMATSGTLALKTETVSNEALGTGSDVSAALSESTTAFSSLMGAAGAAFNATSTEAALNIIESETRTSSTLDTKAKPANDTTKTVIPF